MTDSDPSLGYQGAIPPQGVYFDRVVEEGVKHTRAYYRDGQQVILLVATPDPDRPATWKVLARWRRREKWITHGWGPMAESEAIQMIDAVGIGAEAISGGAMFIGHAAELVPGAAEAVKDEGPVGEP